MKKVLLHQMNDRFIGQCIEATRDQFGVEISFAYSIAESRFVSAWVSQGVAKDRAIQYFVDGFEVGFQRAAAIVNQFKSK